jgi:hypothetical protein
MRILNLIRLIKHCFLEKTWMVFEHVAKEICPFLPQSRSSFLSKKNPDVGKFMTAKASGTQIVQQFSITVQQTFQYQLLTDPKIQ